MLIQGLLLAFLGLGRLCTSAPLTNEQEPMELWEYPGGPKWWVKYPTWHKTVEWQEEDSPSYEAVLELANAYFNWVATHERAWGNEGNIVVCICT